MDIIDKVIDVALAILLIGAIVLVVKYGGYGISRMTGNLKKLIYKGKYPVQSLTFPFKCLKYGDLIEVKDIGACKYLGKRDGKYYIESVSHAASFNGDPYLYADKAYIEQNAIKLMNAHCTKWELNNSKKDE